MLLLKLDQLCALCSILVVGLQAASIDNEVDELKSILQEFLKEQQIESNGDDTGDNINVPEEVLLHPLFNITAQNNQESKDNSQRSFPKPSETSYYLQMDDKQNCDTKGSFSSLEYALTGYNVLYAYPLATGRDPGFTVPLFKDVYEPYRYTSDCRFIVPHGFHFYNSLACQVSFSSEEVRTQRAYESSLLADVSVNGGGWGLSFSANVAYNSDVSEMSRVNNIIVISHARCSHYSISLDTATPPPLSDNFLVALRDLVKSDEEQKYFEFFNSYGTHFVKRMLYGARFTKIHKMTQSAYESVRSQGYSVSATAQYDGIFSIGASASLSQSQKNAVNHFRQSVSTQTTTVGSQPPASLEAGEWSASVQKNPMPLKYELESIENLFTDAFFRNVADIDYASIKQNIIRFKEKYCQRLLAEGVVKSCSATAPAFNVYITQGSYTFTHPLAIEACAKDGNKLANYEQLEAAWRAGLSVCACGWTYDRGAWCPMNIAHKDCFGSVGMHLCNWGENKWDAYCSYY